MINKTQLIGFEAFDKFLELLFPNGEIWLIFGCYDFYQGFC